MHLVAVLNFYPDAVLSVRSWGEGKVALDRRGFVPGRYELEIKRTLLHSSPLPALHALLDAFAERYICSVSCSPVVLCFGLALGVLPSVAVGVDRLLQFALGSPGLVWRERQVQRVRFRGAVESRSLVETGRGVKGG